MGPFEVAPAGREERPGDVVGVLEQGRAAEADPVGDTQQSRDDRLGRPARHPLVAPDAVDRHRSQADARQVIVQPVDAGVALVRQLVDPVVIQRVGRRVLGQVTGPRVGVVQSVHPDRAGVDDRADPVRPSFDGLEDVDRPDHVDERPERWIRPAERDLEGGQVDDVRDPVRVEGGLDRSEVRDVAADERDRAKLLVGHDRAQAAWIAAQVERADRDAITNERPNRPCPDAAEGPGHEESLAVRGRHHTGTRAGSNRQTLTSRPIPSISTVTSSPSPRSAGGSRKMPTPPGVPVAITSPGSRRNDWEQ